MSVIQIQPTNTTPYVLIDANQHKIIFSGKSSPENSLGFYHPLISQAKTFFSASNEPLSVDLSFRYFNTSSSKCLFDLLKMLKALSNDGKEVVINWMYEDDDDDMLETGEDYADLLDLDFNLIPVANISLAR